VRGRRQNGGRANPYREIFRFPGTRGFSAAAALARSPMSMFGLGTILLVSSVTGRYGAAGTVAAAGSIGYAVCAPQMARLADRFGQRRVLRPLAAFFALSTAVFIGSAQLHAPLWALVVSGTVAGASMPSAGSMVRARWSALLGDSPRLHTAFALESVNDEMIFVAGPVIVTLLATEVYPAAGVGVATLLGVTGTLLLAAQRRTEPPSGGDGAAGPGRQDGPAQDGPAQHRPAQHRPRRQRNGPRVPGRGLAVLVYWLMGIAFAGFDLSSVAYAAEQGHKPLTGLVLGSFAAGSAVGGLIYGSRTWRTPVAHRFAITLCLTAAGMSTFWALPGLLPLMLAVFVSGLTISPTFIAGYSLVEQQAPVQRRTEGMAWLSSAISVGVATGAAIAGHIIDQAGARWGYIFAAGGAAAAAVVCVLCLGRLRPLRLAGVAVTPPLASEASR
jgi:MFS family permease